MVSDALGPIPCDSFQPLCPSWKRSFTRDERGKYDVRDEKTALPCACASMILVLAVDQWSSTSPTLKELSLADFAPGGIVPHLYGNDAEAAVAIFGGDRRLLRVPPEEVPSMGTAWMRDDPATGKLVVYKARYDSSD